MSKKTKDRVIITVMFMAIAVVVFRLCFDLVTFLRSPEGALWFFPGLAIGFALVLMWIKKATNGKVDLYVPLIWIKLP